LLYITPMPIIVYVININACLSVWRKIKILILIVILITTENGIIEKREMAEKLGFEITEVEYGKIRDHVNHIRGKFKPVWEMKEKAKTISEWLRPVKKGSNKLRALMSGRGSRSYRNFKFENIRPVST
jgi:hypothetical protein